MLSLVQVRRLALFVCISLACIIVNSASSRADPPQNKFLLKTQLQKQGQIKGGSVRGGTGNPNPNVHINVRPVTTQIHIK